MPRDLFLESLQSQATGNHQRWSSIGLPEKKMQQFDEFGFALDVSMDDPHASDDVFEIPHGTDQADTDNEVLAKQMGRHAQYRDPEPNFMNADAPSIGPAQLQMMSKGIKQEEPPLVAIRRKMMEAEPKERAAMPPEKIRQELEDVYSEMRDLTGRLKSLLSQL